MIPSDLGRLMFGAAEVIPVEDLRRKLALGRPLRVKLGIDPSRPDLHLGHAVVLRKLRQFQEMGHTAVLIVGDYTGRVGDPSGQVETRPFLSQEEIEGNARTYLDQAGLVIDAPRAEIRRNSEWLSGLRMDDVLRLTSSFTVARMLERDDFRTRYRDGKPISLVEFLYPLLQAMDSVAVEADVEMGGTDQTFNLLAGRDIQKEFGMDPQVVFTMPLLEGTDGQRKMSKSYDNCVALTDPPDDMFGRLMRVPDDLVSRYVLLCTDLGPEELEGIEAGLADGSLGPADAKRHLARAVVDLYHGEGSGAAAENAFNLIHRDRELPDEVQEIELSDGWATEGGDLFWLPRILWELGLASSKGEARRLIEQGGVRLQGEQITDPEAEHRGEDLRGKVLQVGRRKFVRLT